MIPSAAPVPFVRDRFTLLAYFMLGYFAYLQAALGPAVPFLRAELGLSYTIAGLHFSALAIGMILAGLTGAELAARWPERCC
jgi:MFS family permease